MSDNKRFPRNELLPRVFAVCVLSVVSVVPTLELRPVRAQGVTYVKRTAGGQNNGSSWTDAYVDLQEALANTTSGEIWVAEGTYTPSPRTGGRAPAFTLPSGVAVYGGFAGNEDVREGRDPTLHPTILSGDLNGDDEAGWVNRFDNSYQVVKALDTAPGTTLDGFVIRGGQAAGGFGPTYGAGIFVEDGNLSLANSIIADNLAFLVAA